MVEIKNLNSKEEKAEATALGYNTFLKGCLLDEKTGKTVKKQI